MHRMGSVADEREARAHQFRHARERKRIGSSATEARESPEPVAETLLKLAQKFSVVPAKDGLYLLRARAPHHGAIVLPLWK